MVIVGHFCPLIFQGDMKEYSQTSTSLLKLKILLRTQASRKLLNATLGFSVALFVGAQPIKACESPAHSATLGLVL